MTMVDFPLPVLPINAVVFPASAVKSTAMQMQAILEGKSQSAERQAINRQLFLGRPVSMQGKQKIHMEPGVSF